MVSLFISKLPGNIRLAKCFQGKLERFSWDLETPAYPLGSVFRGKVTQVLPGGQGAFLDLGSGLHGFINRSGMVFPKNLGKRAKLKDFIKQGQTQLVQIQKSALDQKQPLVSTLLRLQGYFLIHLPKETGVFFSKKFEQDREPIRALLKEEQPSGGWIVRSAAAGIPLEWVDQEKQVLQDLARDFLERSNGAAGKLWQPDPIELWLQDQAYPLPKSIVVDDEPTHHRLLMHLQSRHPGLAPLVSFHQSTQPMFAAYKLQSQLEKALASKVWLSSGAFLVFQQTEALVSIDVNSGKQKKSKSTESAALKANLEAVEEIARQLRLRNLAGIIVIDFIDMQELSERQQLDEACRRFFTQDEVAVDVLPINRLGLVCLSRERYGMDLWRQTQRTCQMCQGEGRIEKDHLLGVRIQTELKRDGESYQNEVLTLEVHPDALKFFQKHRQLLFDELEKQQNFSLQISTSDQLARHDFRIAMGSRETIGGNASRE